MILRSHRKRDRTSQEWERYLVLPGRRNLIQDNILDILNEYTFHGILGIGGRVGGVGGG